MDISKGNNGHEAVIKVKENLVNITTYERNIFKLKMAMEKHRSFRSSKSPKSPTHGHHHPVDLIILDLEMPIMGGLKACEIINKLYDDYQKYKKGKLVPTIINLPYKSPSKFISN